MRIVVGFLLLLFLTGFSSGVRAQQVSAEAAAVRAQQLLVEGMTRAYLDDPEGALALYEEALQYEPLESALLSAISQAHEELGDETNAQFYAEQAVQNALDNPHYARELAALYLRLGRTAEAIEAYEALIERFPDDLEARYELGRLQTIRGDLDAALATYQALRLRTGDLEEVLTQLLQLYARMENDAGVESTLRELIAQEPLAPDYHRLLGDLLRQQGAYDEAATVLEEALRLEPGDVETTLVLGDVYEALGDSARATTLLDDALSTEGASAAELVARATPLYARSELDPSSAEIAVRLLEEALAQEPDHEQALLMLGDLRYRAEAFDEAAELLYRAVQQNPRDVQVWIRTAAAYVQSGDPLRGADVADEALLLFPGQFPLLRIAAYGLMDGYRSDAALRRFDEALTVLREEAPEQTAEASSLLSSMAMLHARKDNDAAADSLYEEALTLDPDNALALNNYAYSLAQRELRLDRAEEMAQRAVDLAPGTASYLDTLGWVYFKQGNLQEAERWIREALDTGEASALVYEQMGDVLAEQGKPDEALQFWQQALTMNPDNNALRAKIEQSGG